MSWHSRISEYEPGSHFADEMLRGPYVRWYHRHVFTDVLGSVEIRDIVSYELPFGPLGRLVHSLLIRPQLEAIFDYRRDVVSKLFGGRTTAVVA
jgi:ligand-binding SRPBCC domain-containing protein